LSIPPRQSLKLLNPSAVEMSNEEEDELIYSDVDADPNEFHIGPRLEVPGAQEFTTRQLHNWILEGEIDLCPPYQRDVVWVPEKQTKLLDTIYCHSYMPPILFTIVKDEDGETVKRCVDGKQRLTSITRFMSGMIPYKDPETNKLWWWTKSNKKGRKVVPDKWKRDFESKRVTCVEYRNLTPADERDIFQRVQLGVSLSPAEKLQAVSSARSDWINELQVEFLTKQSKEEVEENGPGIADVINVNLARGASFLLLGSIAWYCHGLPEQRSYSPTKLEAWLVAEEPLSNDFKSDIVEVLTEFKTICTDKNLAYGFTEIGRRVAPVEFAFIGILLYVLYGSTERQAEEVRNLRTYIREAFPDIRHRPDIIKKLWEFIMTVEKREAGTLAWDSAAPDNKSRRKRKTRSNDDAAGRAKGAQKKRKS